MIDLAALSGAFGLLFSAWQPWLLMVPGLAIGLVFGCVPGLQTSMAMAVFLPTTLFMDFISAMFFLTAIFTGGMFGGGVSAILMNIPGTSSAVATAFDGFPMARQGRHSEALGLALGASAAGTLLGYLVLLVLIQPLSGLVLRLGPTEMVVVALWGLTLIASLSGEHLARGLIAGLFGLLLGTVGMSANGVLRGTADIDWLIDGIAVVPAMIGMFAAAELFGLSRSRYLVADAGQRRVGLAAVLGGIGRAFRHPGLIVRGGLIGVLVGAVPGIGSSVSNLVSYADARRRDADPASFGKGNPKGVVASEAANSSSEGGSMVSLFALGIPGGAGTAILLAAFSMHNVTGGPGFLRNNTDVVYTIILANIAQAALLLGVGLITLQFLALIVRVRLSVLVPCVFVLATFGCYGLTGSMQGPVTLLVFAGLGWVFKRYGYSVPACVIGLLLGRIAEGELLRSYQISGGDPAYVLQRPLTLALCALLVLAVVVPQLLARRRARRIAAATGRAS
jgi:putative tricarboxylic transport membrane protein